MIFIPYEQHGFGPVYDDQSRILILGSFPSVKSREEGFYYAHPRNRFWPTVCGLFGESVPETTEGKKAFLLSHHIALWDAAESCSIIGSGDNTIREVEPVNIREILEEAPIEAIYCNGSTAWSIYMEFLFPITQMAALKLPSTSPANAGVKPELLSRKWAVILEKL